MRDGVELLTDVYAPVAKSLGTLLIRTPYGRTGLIALLTARYYATHGYHVVNQSCRGTFGSGGDFEPFSPEIDDGADTVAWLRRQAWFGGRFALCGASYLGYTAWALMTDPPPELAAAVIAISAHDNHWVAHGAGAFSLEQMLSLFDGFDHLEAGLVGGILRARDGPPTPEAWVRGASSRPCPRNGPRGQQDAVPGVAHVAGCRGPRCGDRCGWVRRSSGSTSPSCCTKAGKIGSSTR